MDIKSRMPGSIISVKVKEGDIVDARGILCVMEAMKMEQPILSPVAGIVKKINVVVGDKVKAGSVLAVVE